MGAALLTAIVVSGPAAVAQKVLPVPSLDPKQLVGTWYEVARYPTKFEERCASQATVLFAEGDKPRALQMGIFCPGKNGSEQEYTNTGKMDKRGNGQIKFGLIWPFTHQYLILALAPDNKWVLTGDPKRKTLSVLSRAPQLDAATVRLIADEASAQSFKVDKLVSLPKQGKTYRAQDGELKETPPAPAVAKPEP